MAKTAQKRAPAAGARQGRKGAASEPVKQTKKQIALSRKQARQNRIIWLSVGALGLIIVLVLGYGLSQQFLLKPADPVAIVDGTKIRTDDYQVLLNYQRYNLHVNIRDLNNALASIDTTQQGNDFLVSFYQQQLQQLQSMLSTLSETTLDQMIDDVLIQEKAKELGITVTAADVQQNIDGQLQQAATSSTQAPITDTQQITPTAVPQEQLDQIYQDALTSMGLTDKEFQSIVERGMYRSKVQDYLATQVVTTGLVIHVEMIVTDTQEVALAAQTRIEAGEDFATVAKEVSSDPQVQDNGGDLGWVTTGQLSSLYGQPMEDLAFSLSVGQVGMVESNNKFYVVKLLDRNENGPLPADVVSQRQSSALSDWLQERKASPDVQIERLLTPDKIPADPFTSIS
jgi:parvulin-like peptidyl-prolyl isomerase